MATQPRGDRRIPAAVATPQSVGTLPLPERRVVFLLDAASELERGLLTDWIQSHHVPTGIPFEVVPIPPSRRRRGRRTDTAALEGALAATDDPLLTPLRVAWLPASEGGGPVRRLVRLLLLGDPRDPGRLRQWWVARRSPERAQ